MQLQKVPRGSRSEWPEASDSKVGQRDWVCALQLRMRCKPASARAGRLRGGVARGDEPMARRSSKRDRCHLDDLAGHRRAGARRTRHLQAQWKPHALESLVQACQQFEVCSVSAKLEADGRDGRHLRLPMLDAGNTPIHAYWCILKGSLITKQMVTFHAEPGSRWRASVVTSRTHSKQRQR